MRHKPRLFMQILTCLLAFSLLLALCPQSISAAEVPDQEDGYLITFHANGGYFQEWVWDEASESEVETRSEEVSYLYGADQDVFYTTYTPQPGEPSMVFLGWATTANAAEPDIVEGETYLGRFSDLWAVWTEGIPVTYHTNKEGLLFYDENHDQAEQITLYYVEGTSVYTGNMPFSYSRPEGSLWQWEYFSPNPDTDEPE